jgi:hypothetical protein
MCSTDFELSGKDIINLKGSLDLTDVNTVGARKKT